MNPNYEFISYKQFPEDQYTKAIAKVRVEKRFVFTFTQKQSKDGGLFWSIPSVGVTDSGEKKYHSAFMLDSQMESEMLLDFVKDSVKRLTNPTVASSSSVQYPHGMGQSPNAAKVTSMSEVAADEQLPF